MPLYAKFANNTDRDNASSSIFTNLLNNLRSGVTQSNGVIQGRKSTSGALVNSMNAWGSIINNEAQMPGASLTSSFDAIVSGVEGVTTITGWRSFADTEADQSPADPNFVTNAGLVSHKNTGHGIHLNLNNNSGDVKGNASQARLWSYHDTGDVDANGNLLSFQGSDTSWGGRVVSTIGDSDQSDLAAYFQTGGYILKWAGPANALNLSGNGWADVATINPNRKTATRVDDEGNLSHSVVGATDIICCRVEWEGLADAGLLFDPNALDTYRSYRITRFMGHQGTNFTKQATYAEQIPEDYIYWSNDGANVGSGGPKYVGGASLKNYCRFCNLTQTHAWFCIPEGVQTQAEMELFVQKVKDNLDPSLVAYFEWSNEPWNNNFTSDSETFFYGWENFHEVTINNGGSGWSIGDEATGSGWTIRVTAVASGAVTAAVVGRRENPTSYANVALAGAGANFNVDVAVIGGVSDKDNMRHEGYGLLTGVLALAVKNVYGSDFNDKARVIFNVHNIITASTRSPLHRIGFRGALDGISAGHPTFPTPGADNGAPLSDYAYAWCPTNYIGSGSAIEENETTLEEWANVSQQNFNTRMKDEVLGNTTVLGFTGVNTVDGLMDALALWRIEADNDGIKLINYEGGNHFDYTGNNLTVRDAVAAMNKSQEYVDWQEASYFANAPYCHIQSCLDPSGPNAFNNPWFLADSLYDINDIRRLAAEAESARVQGSSWDIGYDDLASGSYTGCLDHAGDVASGDTRTLIPGTAKSDIRKGSGSEWMVAGLRGGYYADGDVLIIPEGTLADFTVTTNAHGGKMIVLTAEPWKEWGAANFTSVWFANDNARTPWASVT